MKVVGLIAEYNPFHNGHLYHMEQAKKITGADHIIVVMSGDYVQRGQAAIMPKHLRAQMALCAGASAVFELPVCYATGSAETFALGSVSLLDRLGIVDSICFGSECDDITSMKEIADILSDEPAEYTMQLKKHLQSGITYPLARENALSDCFPDKNYAEILSQPNNILGIEYLKALRKLNSSITPYTIMREGSDYHDEILGENYSSASALRTMISHWTKTDPLLAFSQEESELSKHIPMNCISLWKEHYLSSFPVYMNTFSLLLKYCLLQEDSFEKYQDVSEELSNRIVNRRNEYKTFDQFCELLKTKELTYTRISRALLHILLHITKEATEHFIGNGIHYYAHLLGFKQVDAKILTDISNQGQIQLLTKLSAADHLSPDGKAMLRQDCLASDLYQSVITDLYQSPFQNELIKQIIRV